MTESGTTYQQFWKLLKDLGLWDHPTYLARKGLVTHPLDRREIMPKCVQNEIRSRYPNPVGIPYTNYRSSFL
eukprot:Em0477g1a